MNEMCVDLHSVGICIGLGVSEWCRGVGSCLVHLEVDGSWGIYDVAASSRSTHDTLFTFYTAEHEIIYCMYTMCTVYGYDGETGSLCLADS